MSIILSRNLYSQDFFWISGRLFNVIFKGENVFQVPFNSSHSLIVPIYSSGVWVFPGLFAFFSTDCTNFKTFLGAHFAQLLPFIMMKIHTMNAMLQKKNATLSVNTLGALGNLWRIQVDQHHLELVQLICVYCFCPFVVVFCFCFFLLQDCREYYGYCLKLLVG